MADSAPIDVKPPSAQAVKAAMDLLPRVPKTWSAVPELSRLEEEGLGLLVAADLVERRVVVGLRAGANGTTEPDVRSMQSWYRNQRNAHGFPKDPRNLSDEELRKHFPRR